MNLIAILPKQINIQGINTMFEALPDRLIPHKWMIVALMLAATVFLACGARYVVIDESLTAYFHQDDPVKQAYDQFRTVFGGDEYVYVVYRARDGDIFSTASVSALKAVHHALADYRLTMTPGEPSILDRIDEVKSLINVQYMEAMDGTLYSRNFIGDRLPLDHDSREAVRYRARNHPDYPGVYLSDNSAYGGILIRTDFNARKLGEEIPAGKGGTESSHESVSGGFDDSDEFSDTGIEADTADQTDPSLAVNEPQALEQTDIREYTAFMKALREILDRPEHNGALEFYPVGNPVLMDFFSKAVIEDMGRLMSICILLITGLLWVLFRSLSAVVWPLALVILTIVWILGLVGWLHIPMSAMVQVIVILALSVGIADSVHILSGYLFFRNKGLSHLPAMRACLKKSGLACLLTSLTTAVGLLALTLVPLTPIAVFGLFAAVAVLLAFLFTIILLPVMLDFWAPVPKLSDRKKAHPVQRILGLVDTTGYRYSRTVAAVFSLAAVFLFYGLLQLKVDSDFVDIIKKGLPLRDAYSLVDDYLGGTGSMEIMLDFKRENALKDPDVLFAMEAVQAFLEKDGRVRDTTSLVNVVKESFKALNDDDPQYYRIPADPPVLAQTVFMFENANPKDRTRLVSDDYARARIGMRSVNVGSIEAMEIMEGVQGFIDDTFVRLKQTYPDLSVTLTGNMALLAIMLDYLAWAQIKSFGMALVVISVILLLVLGSWKAGLVALFPNLFPILTTFGLMGFLGIPLDADTLLVAPIIIGLAVDDTIHFMTHFRVEIQENGTILKAVKAAMQEAGQAITFTSVILSAGFLVFILSFHNGLSRFGIFAAIAIMTALIADIFLLPALCRLVNLNFNQRSFQ